MKDNKVGQIGNRDYVVQLPQSPKPKVTSSEEYAGYPKCITIREVKVNGRLLDDVIADPDFVFVNAIGRLYKMRSDIDCAY